MPYKVFISHSSRDTWVAEQIELHVQKTGAETFLDRKHINHGDDFEEVIFKALKQADEILVLITPATLKKHEYIWSEIGAARLRDIRIVAVLYGVTLNDLANKPVLRNKDVVNIDHLNNYFEQLKVRVAKKTSTP